MTTPIRLARLRALPGAIPAGSTNGSSTSDSAIRNGGPGSTNGTGAQTPRQGVTVTR